MQTQKHPVAVGVIAFLILLLGFVAITILQKPRNIVETVEVVKASLKPSITDGTKDKQVWIKLHNKGKQDIHEVYGNLLLFPKDGSSPETIPQTLLFTTTSTPLKPGQEWEGQVQINTKETLFLSRLPRAISVVVQPTHAFERKTDGKLE